MRCDVGRDAGCAPGATAADRDSERDATTGDTSNASTSGGDDACYSEHIVDAYFSDRPADHGYDARGRRRLANLAAGADTDHSADTSGHSEFRDSWRAACDTSAGASSRLGTGTLRTCAGHGAAERVDDSALKLDYNAGQHDSTESGTDSDCAVPSGDG